MISITYTLSFENEDVPVRGNVMDSGDDVEDKKCEDAILERLAYGDSWAWCTVCVTAALTLPGNRDFKGSAYLGACSFENADDFRINSGYYHDMCAEAKVALLTKLEQAIARGLDAKKFLDLLSNEKDLALYV